MRRIDREIAQFSQMISIVERCDCCRLGLVDGEEAYIVPLNFGYEVEGEQLTLYFHCAREGRKLSLLEKCSVVSFEMDTGHQLTTGELACEFSFLYQCVMGTGTAQLLEGTEKVHGLERIMAHYAGPGPWEFDARLLERTAVIRLTVSHWSCKQH